MDKILYFISTTTGLPHAHILICLASEDKPRNADHYNTFICAEIPSPERLPRLYSIITRQLLHGPCGEHNPSCVCMDKEKNTCTKYFPKPLQPITEDGRNSFPRYRRRARFQFPKFQGDEMPPIIMNDEWVVPYNPYFCLKYNAHINWEISSGLRHVKYIFKYMTKGHDKASISLQRMTSTAEGHAIQPSHNVQENPVVVDEIQNYIDSRYVGVCEAFWRILSFPMHSHYPPVTRLQIHEENQHTVLYEEGEEMSALQATAQTTLTEYFNTVLKETQAPLSPGDLGFDNEGNTYPGIYITLSSKYYLSHV